MTNNSWKREIRENISFLISHVTGELGRERNIDLVQRMLMATVRLFGDLTLKERDDGLRGSVPVAVMLRSVQCFLHGLFNFFISLFVV